jgi:hypothetical protein
LRDGLGHSVAGTISEVYCKQRFAPIEMLSVH